MNKKVSILVSFVGDNTRPEDRGPSQFLSPIFSDELDAAVNFLRSCVDWPRNDHPVRDGLINLITVAHRSISAGHIALFRHMTRPRNDGRWAPASDIRGVKCGLYCAPISESILIDDWVMPAGDKFVRGQSQGALEEIVPRVLELYLRGRYCAMAHPRPGAEKRAQPWAEVTVAP